MPDPDERRRISGESAAFRRQAAIERAPLDAVDSLGRVEDKLATLIRLQQETNQLLQDLLDRQTPATPR